MARVKSLLLLLGTAVHAIHIWPTPDDLPSSIPESCRAALFQDLTCNGSLITGQSLGAGRLFDNFTLANYCLPLCLESLLTFKKNIDVECGNTAYQMDAESSPQTGPSIADPLVWAYNISCLTLERVVSDPSAAHYAHRHGIPPLLPLSHLCFRYPASTQLAAPPASPTKLILLSLFSPRRPQPYLLTKWTRNM